MGKGGCSDWCPTAAGWLTGLTSSNPKLPLMGGCGGVKVDRRALQMHQSSWDS